MIANDDLSLVTLGVNQLNVKSCFSKKKIIVTNESNFCILLANKIPMINNICIKKKILHNPEVAS